jgi:hypothetical protein
MPRVFTLILLFFLVTAGLSVRAQFETDAEADTAGDNVLFERQWSLGLQLNTNGWGLKFRKGKNITFLTQRMWEIEFSTYKAAKEIKSINPYFSDSKSYVYGKLNYLYFLRGGVGIQHILNQKPYWGGVQLSFLAYGGLSVGITKPVYLYIVTFTSPTYDYQVAVQKYDPDIHYVDNIYGRAPFLTGILNVGFYPGIYLRSGLEFEFGTLNKRLKTLEVGGVLDVSPRGIPIMAYNPRQNFFLTLYLSFSFGKRYNK